MNTWSGRFFLLTELLILCVAVPTLIIIGKLASAMFLFLWGAAGYCAFVYRRHYFETWHDLWRWDRVTWAALWPILLRWVVMSIAMYGFMAWYDSARLFGIWYRAPHIIPWLFVAYPLVSALPQEFVFCSFFFRRYERYFGSGWLMIIASAVVFAYAHMLYINPVAPTISFIGGLIFAHTYAKTKSLALVTIEHGLYGNSLFLIGLGWYFYSGAVV